MLALACAYELFIRVARTADHGGVVSDMEAMERAGTNGDVPADDLRAGVVVVGLVPEDVNGGLASYRGGVTFSRAAWNDGGRVQLAAMVRVDFGGSRCCGGSGNSGVR